ncbi:hypothetical protein L7F22_001860 [Adiantum nelumboides]|nr:hypothetical protein [Adiantum nelumboides]
MEDDQLILQNDASIVEAVYARLGRTLSPESLYDAKKDVVLQPKQDSMGELYEYDLSSLFDTSEEDADHNIIVMLHAAEEASSGSTPPSADNLDNSTLQGGSGHKLDSSGEDRGWTLFYPSGSTPGTRYHHSAAVIGRKMLVVGGDSDHGMLNDVQQLHLGKLNWKVLAPPSKTKAAQQLPLCKGHSLIAWGQRLLLVTGETDPPMEHVSVWSFDMEKKTWSKVEAKGELPNVRSGHSVTRAGSVLILFGGEDAKGRKLNDLHMFDLKSSMWLPLLAMGSVPCPRSKHVAAIYDDRLLLVFSGVSKSKYLNDLYALDFEAMEWSRLKTRGVIPGPRAECVGVLFNDKWYIAGGELNGTRCLETVMLDVARMTWSVVAHSNENSSLASQGFSMVLSQRKERSFLVAFGGKRQGIASEVEVLFISTQDFVQSKSPDGVTVKEPPKPAKRADQILVDPGAMAENERLREEDRCSPSDDQSKHVGNNLTKNNLSGEIETVRDTEVLVHAVCEKDWKEDAVIDTGQADESEFKLSSITEVNASYEKKLAAAFRKNAVLEGQLKAASSSREDAERSLGTVIKSKQKAEKRLAVTLKENEDLKEKLAAAELTQEESIGLTNIVHAENMRLEHDLAFLKAVLEDTQKELQTTRGVLSGERSRSFQLQVELFELKQTVQTLQSSENPS